MNFSNPILTSFFSECGDPDCPDHSHQKEPEPPLEELTLRYFPDSILNQKCEPVPQVTDEVRRLAKNMLYTMMLGKGIGLAAPQVGILLRLFVIDLGWIKGLDYAEPRVFINPTVTLIGEEEVTIHEGCLSFPGSTAIVKRRARIRVEAFDMEGEPDMRELGGMLAVVVQHEYDHLDGITIRKHLSPYELGIAQRNIKKDLRAKKRR